MDASALHTILVYSHAASGMLGFIVGLALIFRSANRQLFGVYLASIIGVSLFLAGAMASHWGSYSVSERIIFSGLLILSLYMIYRSMNANSLIRNQPDGWMRAYKGHIGFNLISLVEGVIIITLLNAGAGGWVVAVSAGLGIAAGSWAVGQAQKRNE